MDNFWEFFVVAILIFFKLWSIIYFLFFKYFCFVSKKLFFFYCCYEVLSEILFYIYKTEQTATYAPRRI